MRVPRYSQPDCAHDHLVPRPSPQDLFHPALGGRVFRRGCGRARGGQPAGPAGPGRSRCPKWSTARAPMARACRCWCASRTSSATAWASCSPPSARRMQEWEYAGGYTAVYPIKVNQHRGVAGTLASHSGEGFGLEAGSKPELMAVLALSRPGGLIVCNGYKDREYIRLALIGRKLGLQTFIVIEKPSELALVIEEAKALDVKPGLGVRMRLASLGAGKWQNSGGDKAKFGLSPAPGAGPVEVSCATTACRTAWACCISTWVRRSPTCATSPTACARPRAISSNCPSWARTSATSMSAAAWASTTKARVRAAIARSTTASNQYASNIVQPLAEACEEHKLTPPRIVTECGRAMTAHHAVLIANVSEVEQAPEGRVPPSHADEPRGDPPPARDPRRTGFAPGGGAVPRCPAPPQRRPVAVRAGPDRPDPPRAHRRPVLCHRPCGARAPEQRRAQPPRPAGRIERAPGRQVFRQLQRVRIDPRRVGDRPGVPDPADRAPGRSADCAAASSAT